MEGRGIGPLVMQFQAPLAATKRPPFLAENQAENDTPRTGPEEAGIIGPFPKYGLGPIMCPRRALTDR